MAKKEFKNSSKEIFPFIFEEKQYWLKKARATKPNKIQKFFSIFFKFELLIPSLYKTSKEALEFESSKLEKFKSMGINVPNVVYKYEDFFVLEDTGESVYSYFKTIEKDMKEEQFYYFVDLMIVELAKIHNLGFFHGGSQMRNFTTKDKKVFVLDFEESFSKDTDIKTLQYRDFLLFLLSFTKFKKLNFQIDYVKIVTKYKELSNNKNFEFKLKRFSKRLSFFIKLSELKFIKRLLGSDVLQFFKLFKNLNLS
ncbi:kinase [Aliarcobacter vitoriensis]|uniref:Kinase n=1 Tax=Aliarcobacter vitoriensis TaxID=2011099 RepID=A0A366MUD9_9BACT|nr:kinase [Aliarcobacter vitoriensis]